MNRQPTTSRRSSNPTAVVDSPIIVDQMSSTASVVLLITIGTVALFSIFIGFLFLYRRKQRLAPIIIDLDESFGPGFKENPNFEEKSYTETDSHILSEQLPELKLNLGNLDYFSTAGTSRSKQSTMTSSTVKSLSYNPGTILLDETGISYVVNLDGYPMPITTNAKPLSRRETMLRRRPSL